MSSILEGRVGTVERVPVGTLRLWDQNPRRIDPERLETLKLSMANDPQMLRARPLIALPDGRVIAGNQRLRAALELGWEDIERVVADLDEDTATTWAIRDNVGYGEWDDEGLASILYGLVARDIDLDLTGLAPEERDALMAAAAADVDPPPAPPANPRGENLAKADVSIGEPEHRPVAGEAWRVGPHVLVIEAVYDGWDRWVDRLEEGMLLAVYPTPTLPLTRRADRHRLVMVQPDEWLAGHLLDKYEAVRGPGLVERL